VEELVRVASATIDGETVPAVDSRDLHRALGVETRHRDWITRRLHHALLVEHEDFEVSLNSERNPVGGRPDVSYVLSLDAAKHLAMLERNQKGHEIRRFFIEVEKRNRGDLLPVIRAEARAAAMEMLAAELKILRTEISNTDLWTLASYAKAKSVGLTPRQSRAIGSGLAAVCRSLGLRMGSEPTSHRIGKAPRTFPKSVLDAHFSRLVDRHVPELKPTLLPFKAQQ